jgi:hypothetical protein
MFLTCSSNVSASGAVVVIAAIVVHIAKTLQEWDVVLIDLLTSPISRTGKIIWMVCPNQIPCVIFSLQSQSLKVPDESLGYNTFILFGNSNSNHRASLSSRANPFGIKWSTLLNTIGRSTVLVRRL